MSEKSSYQRFERGLGRVLGRCLEAPPFLPSSMNDRSCYQSRIILSAPINIGSHGPIYDIIRFCSWPGRITVAPSIIPLGLGSFPILALLTPADCYHGSPSTCNNMRLCGGQDCRSQKTVLGIPLPVENPLSSYC